MKNKDRYESVNCRDFRITSSGYIFVQYEASCLDKDGKGKDFTRYLYKSSPDEVVLIEQSVSNLLKVMSTLVGTNYVGDLHWFPYWTWPENQGQY